jgi:hypothetical protein
LSGCALREILGSANMISPVVGYNTMAQHHGKAQVGYP